MRKQVTKRVILITTCLVFALVLSGTVAAEDTTLVGDSGGAAELSETQNQKYLEQQNSSSENESQTMKDPQVLIIHSSESTRMTNDAAHHIMDLINPTQLGYKPNDKSTWLVKFDIRTTTQIGQMSTVDLKALIENADIIIAEWIFEPGMSNFKNVISANPEILKNKPNKIFLILESDPSVTKLSQINGQYIFQKSDGTWISDGVIGDTSTKNTILYDLKNGNIQRINQYKATYSKANGYLWFEEWIDSGIYYANKGTENYENQYKWVLKKFADLNGNPWTWTPAPARTFSKEMLYRDGVIYTTLKSYLAQYPLDPSKPTVGLVSSEGSLLSGNMDFFQTTIEKMVAQGMNVIPVVGYYSGTNGTLPTNVYSAMIKFFVYDPAETTHVVTNTDYEANPSKYKYRIDALVSFYTFTLGSGFLEQTNSFLSNMNVPVFRAMTSTKRSEGEWLTSDDGLMWSDSYYQIAIPETQGIVEPIFVATTETEMDTVTGAMIGSYKAITERIEKLASRVKNWSDLKYMDNANKKIALVYYNYPPGKQNIGASYLNVPDTIVGILNRLKLEGYTVEDIPQNGDALVSLMIERGINVANWAPGVLEELANNPNTILWDADEYIAWFNTLHPLAQKQVTEGPVGYIEEVTKLGVSYGANNDVVKAMTIKTIDKWTEEMISLANTYPEKATQAIGFIKDMGNALKEVIGGNTDAWMAFFNAKTAFQSLSIPGLNGWGQAPGNIMTITRNGKKYIVIPGLRFGNVFIGPEPQRGWEADASKFYHSTVVPPTHQYLAWYAYINQQFNADAQVHVGRHASYEWLPTKQVALSQFDYSDIMAGDIPSVYLYIMDGVGEGTQAKRRGLAVIVDHLTPPLKTVVLYGGLLELKDLLNLYETAAQDMKEHYRKAIADKVKEMNLATDLGIINPDNINDADIEEIHDYLVNLQDTLLPYGLHTFGQSWTDQEIALLATSIVSVDSSTSSSLQKLICQVMHPTWNYNDLTIEQAGQLNQEAQNWILQIITGQKTAAELTTDATLQAKLNDAKSYADKIRNSFTSEMDSLVEALSGGYVTPGKGNDPIKSPESLPTGINFYALDESKMPTQVAWDLGKKLADMALAQLDNIPEKIAAVVWCVETARDDGTMVSFVLRMLGIQPWTYNTVSKKWEMKYTATPMATLLSDLNAVRTANGLAAVTKRPRVDVVVTTSGLFRDLFPRLLTNMDRSYRLALAASYNQIVAQYPQLTTALDYVLLTLVDAKYTNFKGDESLDQNYIAKHWIESTLGFIGRGISSNESGELAITRIFAPPVGEYGAGVNKAVEQSWTWENREEVADVYINRMSHSYTERNWGISNPNLFRKLLKGIETAYHSRCTNLYGVLDNDDYYDYYGGLSMAIEMMNNGKAPNLNVLYYANTNNPQIYSLQQFMAQEMRSRYFNPEWIQGMMGEGYSGARYISNKFVSYLWGWQVTSPSTVKNWMWDEVANTYVKDQYNLGVTKWLSTGNNAYSMISITGTLLTAAYEGYWKTDLATLNMVRNTWAQLIATNGVACCDCSCGNLAMIEWASKNLNPDLLAKLNSEIYKATGNSQFAPGQIPSQTQQPATQSQTTGSTASVTSQSISDSDGSSERPQSEESTSPGDNGYAKAYEVSDGGNSGSSDSGLPLAAIVGVIALVCLIGYGYFRAR